jgi:hypothetical protein
MKALFSNGGETQRFMGIFGSDGEITKAVEQVRRETKCTDTDGFVCTHVVSKNDERFELMIVRENGADDTDWYLEFVIICVEMNEVRDVKIC